MISIKNLPVDFFAGIFTGELDSESDPGTSLDGDDDSDDDSDIASTFSLSELSSASDRSKPTCHFSCHSLDPIR